MSTPPKPKKLLAQVIETIRLKHYSDRPGETYVQGTLYPVSRSCHPHTLEVTEGTASLTYPPNPCKT